jgi:ribosome-binding protein aMBF1 (putative translation factor)
MQVVALQDNFVANVRAALDKRGWSQRELARQAEIHWQTVGRILSGGMNPTTEMCEKIADALEITPPEKIFRKPG